MTTTVERRAAIELRAAAGRRLQGYAAVFGQETRIDGFTESIARGAFAASLRDASDILALVDHDSGKMLARTRSGTLKLSEDERGLAFDIALPNTTLANDVLALAERGDIGGASFAFKVRNGGERWSGKHRELRDLDLVEISVVSAWPAYSGTSVSARTRMKLPARLKLARLYMGTI
jgi:HK97 family phage prohead protease